MKKEWKAPELEVLEVKETMLGSTGPRSDADYPTGTPIDEMGRS